MAGLLDFLNTPQGMGLLSAVAGGMAGARRGQPINSIGRGLVTGLSGYAGAQDQLKQDGENALTKQYRQLQMQKLESDIAQQKAQREWKAGLPAVMKNRTQQVAPNENTQLMAASMGSQAAPEIVDNSQAVQDYLMQPDSPYADDLIKQQFVPKTPIKLGKGDRLVDPTTYQPLTNLPPMQDDQPDKVRQYKFAVENDGFKGSYVDFLKIVPEAQAEIMYPWRASEAQDRDRRRDIDERKADYELPRPRKPQQPAGFSVTDPNGVAHSFPTKQQADAFKRAIGGR